MCIAVCPVGALTDRHFAHHPWELDTTETICGFCDVGCTINVEVEQGHRSPRHQSLGARRQPRLHLRTGKWGHEQVQHPDRDLLPRRRAKRERRSPTKSTWDDAIDTVAETLAHYQGDQFAALASPDATNEEAYVAPAVHPRGNGQPTTSTASWRRARPRWSERPATSLGVDVVQHEQHAGALY